MNKSATIWGLIWLGSGVVVGMGWLPGSANWDMAPRIGVTVLLVMLGLTVIGVANAGAFLRRTTKPADYDGACPVGARCACGTFNLKPRTTCKSCGVAVTY